MALSQSELQELARLMVEEIQPEQTEVLLTTGEEFEAPALDIARTYMRATGLQKDVFIALAKSIEPDVWKRW